MTDRSSDRDTPVLEIEDLTAEYGSTRVLHGISLSLMPGEIHAILGPNGCGKSTLLKAVAGHSVRTTGRISFPADSKYAARLEPKAARSKIVNFVHQDLALFDTLNVTENVLLGGAGLPRNRGRLVRWREAHASARNLMQSFGVHVDVRSPISRLSRRDQTFVGIARAINSMPGQQGILFLDEVTASLDEADATQLLSAVVDLARRQQHGVVLITHRLDEVWKYADYVTVLRDGRPVVQGPVDLAMRERVLSAFDGGSHVSDPSPAGDADEASEHVGNSLLTMRVASFGVVRDLSLTLHHGEILGVTSLAGGGKEDVARLMYGSLKPASGSVDINGADFKSMDRSELARRGVGLVPGNRSLEGVVGPLSAADNMMLLNYRRARKHGFTLVRSIAKVALPGLRSFSVSPLDPRKPLGEFSGGNQQKVVIARWLAFDYATVILVEPTAGVDVGARRVIYEAIRKKRESGTSFLVISSDNSELAEICDRVLVMRDGKVVSELKDSQLNVDELVRSSVLDQRSHGGD